jgi:hypothetical protein
MCLTQEGQGVAMSLGMGRQAVKLLVQTGVH